jgi:hypothetical protein
MLKPSTGCNHKAEVFFLNTKRSSPKQLVLDGCSEIVYEPKRKVYEPKLTAYESIL